jgi:Domain of unknown function (DUF4403)
MNLGLGLLLLLAGCAASATPTSNPGSSTDCTVQLQPRPRTVRRDPPPVAEAPESRVVVHVEAPLAPLHRRLEERVPRRLAEGRFRIGPGGMVSYEVQRGELSVRVTRSALMIETVARAKAEACRGDDCYARCEPEARVVAEVPLLLGADYRFPKTVVSTTFTRGCKVRALGGLLTLDVTPTLQAQLEPELRKVERDIERQMPDLLPRLTEAWKELNEPRSLPLVGCFVLQPFGVVQGPVSPSSSLLEAHFAILARPELRTTCGVAPAVAALPPLAADRSLPREGLVRLGMVTSLDRVARSLESASVSHAVATSYGSDIDARLTLRGRVCGEVALQAAPDFSGDGQHIRLARPTIPAGDAERLREAGLDARTLTALARVAPLLSVQAFETAAPALAAALSQRGMSVSAHVSSARPAGAAARGDELVAWLEARGSLSVKLEAP